MCMQLLNDSKRVDVSKIKMDKNPRKVVTYD